MTTPKAKGMMPLHNRDRFQPIMTGRATKHGTKDDRSENAKSRIEQRQDEASRNPWYEAEKDGDNDGCSAGGE